MELLRVLILSLLVVGIPLQGWATVSQVFCRMAPTHSAPHATQAPVDHAAHGAHDHLDHGAAPAMHPRWDHPPLTSADPGANDHRLGDASHQCGHCAQCAAAHAMASVPVLAMHWPKAHPIWVGAVPKLHGRVFTSAPERPPRALTA